VLRSRDLELLPPDSVDDWSAKENSLDREAATSETRTALRELIGSLPRELRDPTTLFYLKQCTQREAAAFLGRDYYDAEQSTSFGANFDQGKDDQHGEQTELTEARDLASRVGRIVSVRGPDHRCAF